jgi:hypothetical protein
MCLKLEKSGVLKFYIFLYADVPKFCLFSNSSVLKFACFLILRFVHSVFLKIPSGWVLGGFVSEVFHLDSLIGIWMLLKPEIFGVLEFPCFLC